jgi:hypothetical protein
MHAKELRLSISNNETKIQQSPYDLSGFKKRPWINNMKRSWNKHLNLQKMCHEITNSNI